MSRLSYFRVGRMLGREVDQDIKASEDDPYAQLGESDVQQARQSLKEVQRATQSPIINALRGTGGVLKSLVGLGEKDPNAYDPDSTLQMAEEADRRAEEIQQQSKRQAAVQRNLAVIQRQSTFETRQITEAGLTGTGLDQSKVDQAQQQADAQAQKIEDNWNKYTGDKSADGHAKVMAMAAGVRDRANALHQIDTAEINQRVGEERGDLSAEGQSIADRAAGNADKAANDELKYRNRKQEESIRKEFGDNTANKYRKEVADPEEAAQIAKQSHDRETAEQETQDRITEISARANESRLRAAGERTTAWHGTPLAGVELDVGASKGNGTIIATGANCVILSFGGLAVGHIGENRSVRDGRRLWLPVPVRRIAVNFLLEKADRFTYSERGNEGY